MSHRDQDTHECGDRDGPPGPSDGNLTPKSRPDYVKKIQRSRPFPFWDHQWTFLDFFFQRSKAGKDADGIRGNFKALDEGFLDNVSTVVGVKVHEKELEFLLMAYFSRRAPRALGGRPVRLGQV